MGGVGGVLGSGGGYASYTPATGPALDVAGTTVGELVGWRIWQLRADDRLLASYSANRIWLPGEPMEGKPDDHGGAGVWAFKEPYRAAAKARECYSAFGTVWLWGEVVEHADGYRAEFAEIRSIDWAMPTVSVHASPPDELGEFIEFRIRDGETVQLWPPDKRLLAALRQRYGVGSDKDATTIAGMVPERKKSADPE